MLVFMAFQELEDVSGGRDRRQNVLLPWKTTLAQLQIPSDLTDN